MKNHIRVIAVDVSEAAITLAKKETHHQPNLIFQVLDATDPTQTKALHDQFGDMNIYP